MSWKLTRCLREWRSARNTIQFFWIAALVACASAGTAEAPGRFQIEFEIPVTSSYSILGVSETPDGGFAVAGGTNGRMFLLKTDTGGGIAFYRTYDNYSAAAMDVTGDGGFILAGERTDFEDYVLLKTNATGDIEWSRAYDVGYREQGLYAVRQTPDGGYVASGSFTIRVDAAGVLQWARLHIAGGGNTNSVQLTSSGGYIATGEGQYGNTANDYNAVVTRLDATGNVVWNRVYGGHEYDWSASVQQTADGGFVVAGWTRSFGAGATDCFVLKTDAAGALIWAHTFGSLSMDSCQQVVELPGGGYAAAGSFAGSVYLLRIDAAGALLWSRTYASGTAYALDTTSDGGFLIAARSAGGRLLLIKADSAGDTGNCNQSTPATMAASAPFLVGTNPTASTFNFTTMELSNAALSATPSTIASCGGCEPTTCTDEGAGCGTIPDGCGGTLDCGGCLSPETCGGGGIPNVCGSPGCAACGPGKVSICHTPPGNPGNARTLCIDAVSETDHRGHGDRCGPC